jgi:hypothetical protein
MTSQREKKANVTSRKPSSFYKKLLAILEYNADAFEKSKQRVKPMIDWIDARAERVGDFRIEPARKAFKALKNRIGNVVLDYDLDPTYDKPNVRPVIIRDVKFHENADGKTARIQVHSYEIRTDPKTGKRVIDSKRAIIGYNGYAEAPEAIRFLKPMTFPKGFYVNKWREIDAWK